MTDWDSWRKHVDHVVATRGRWIGLGDGDGAPMFDLPDPGSVISADQWMDAPDLEFTMPALTPSGSLSRAAELLVVDGLGGFEQSGRPVAVPDTDYTLLMAFPGSGGVVRRGGVVTHVTANDAENDGSPNEITIHALNCMKAWEYIPAVSWPGSWWGATPYAKTSDESGKFYDQSHLMARVELATRASFVWKNGRAGFVIRRLAQESIDAVGFTQQDPDGTRWVDDPYIVVEVPEVDNSREISVLARDGSLWETVAGQAKNAGVILGARMWWPGDLQVRCWTPATSSMTPDQVDITPSEGAPFRTVGEHSFPHAMTVLTVTEV